MKSESRSNELMSTGSWSERTLAGSEQARRPGLCTIIQNARERDNPAHVFLRDSAEVAALSVRENDAEYLCRQWPPAPKS